MVPTLITICLACLVTALIDMGMNGSRHAGWAPWGLAISMACMGGLYLLGAA
jgi:hypothetical protein